ncbi:MAG TPA: LamG domain-containing protein [Flavisolibacter sp.]|nr:LamG domain-containing protein [Flavisolibacter sp.]
MKILSTKSWSALSLGALFTITLASCDKDGINDYVPTRPIGGYNSSSEIAPNSLVAKWSFDGSLIDSSSNLNGTASGTSFTPGRKGQALQGSATGKVEYPTPGGAITGLQSFTVTMWINTQKHTGGAQSVFMLPKTSDFWGNMFMLIEGNGNPHDSMLVKFHFDGQWAELTGTNQLPDMYNGWKHLAFSYNANTSKFSAYLNGGKRNLPASITDRSNAGNPLGPISFTDISKLVIGGFQQHLGTPWSAPDGWMLNYTGKLDEFRIYNTALTDSDVNSLYKLEALGR